MENEVIKLAASQGIWAVLSIVLIFYILKAQETRDSNQEEREKNYQTIISSLSDKFNILESMQKDVEDIKEFISEKSENK
jgi:hypothetical protein